MWQLLRFQLTMLPMLWSLWQQDDGAGDGQDDAGAADAKGDAGDGTTYRTQADFDRALANRLARERPKLEAEIAQKLKDEADAKALEEQQQWQALAEKRADEKRALEEQLRAREAQERERVLRYEIRDAARDARFADPDDAYHLLDRTAVVYAEDGTPTNVVALVTALAERKPHLLRDAGQPPRATPPGTRASGNVKPTRDERVKTYLEQAGVRVP